MKNLKAICTLALALAIGAAVAAPPKAAKPTPPKGPAVTKAAKHKFSAKQARAIALKKYPGKVVGKVALENEEGKWQYAVNIQSGKTFREVMVGADTGKIENVEVTTPGKEKKETAAEKPKPKTSKPTKSG